MPWYLIKEGDRQVNKVFVLTKSDLLNQLRDGQEAVETDGLHVAPDPQADSAAPEAA